jgi:hypothetical protein
MAIVRRMELVPLNVEAKHTETDATYCWVKDREGARFLQIDTYGSADRVLRQKKSQSIRFSEAAIRQLSSIISGSL